MFKKITVVIPVYNDKENLGKCLKAFRDIDYKDYELIIVDDCSSDGLLDSAEISDCKVIKLSQRMGPAAARQEGIKYATGEIVAFLDSDCRPEIDWLRKISSYLKEDIGGIGGVYIYDGKDNYFSSFLKHFSQYWFSLWPQEKTNFLLGGNCAYWTQVLRENRKGDDQLYFKGLASGDDTLMSLEISRRHRLSFFSDLKVAHSYFGPFSFLRKQIKWGFTRTVISLSFIKEKLFQANDLPVIQLIVQLLATVGFFASLATLKVILVRVAFSLLLFSHLNSLIYLYKKTNKILFIPYAFFVLLARNVCYLLGILKGIFFLLKKYIWHWVDNVQILFNYLNPQAPSKINLFVTTRCNANCDYCFLESRDGEQSEATLDEFGDIIKKLGVLPYVVITGGEPFLRDDVAAIGKLFYKYCLSRYLVIATNGFFTDKITKVANELLRDCPWLHLTVQISVDGFKLEHDRTKKLDKCFDQVVETISKLGEAKTIFRNLNINVSIVVTEMNKSKLDEIVYYFKEIKGVDNCFVTLKRCPPKIVKINDIPDKEYLNLLDRIAIQSNKNKLSIFGKIYGRIYAAVANEMKHLLTKKEYLRPCLAGKKFLVVNEKAELCLCEPRNEIFGSLKNARSIRELLGRKQSKYLIKKMRQEKCFCNWGCAVTANFVFSTSFYSVMAKTFFKDLLIWKK